MLRLQARAHEVDAKFARRPRQSVGAAGPLDEAVTMVHLPNEVSHLKPTELVSSSSLNHGSSAEEALIKGALATAAELAAIQGAISEAAIIAVTDVTGKIEQVNENFVRISKYSREELIGQDHRLLNSGLHSREFMRDLWVTIANGKVWRSDLRNRAKDGSLYWVDTTIAPVLNERGKPVKYIAVRFDITARKLAELKIARCKAPAFN